MARERIYLFDTTLRDGQQTPGVDFSLEDKLVVMDLLDEMGIDYIEGGYPGGNPTDTALFAPERKSRATFTAFGMTKRAGRSVSNDSGLQHLLQAKAKAACFVAICSRTSATISRLRMRAALSNIMPVIISSSTPVRAMKSASWRLIVSGPPMAE